MFTVALLALLAVTEYACVEAAPPQHARRQSNAPVAVWGACNFPSQGVNGPLPCADGGSCICKDATYAQCRTQVDGSWTPAGSSWQCQQPGDSPSGASGGSDPASPPAAQPSGSTTPSGDTSTPATDSKSAEQRVGGSQINANQLGSPEDAGSPAAASSSTAASLPAPAQSTTPSSPGGTNSQSKSEANLQGSSSDSTGITQAATIGGCDAASHLDGWDGSASTSFYGWMGSACQCGQASWQWEGSSPGFYNAAVNQRLFNGNINGAGQPNCGTSCGQCYELSTSGFNAYSDGVAAGSTITVQIVDACYSSGSEWCGSTSDDFKDSSGCGVHFDIQTGGPGSAGVSPVGSDGNAWNGGGQIVYYKPTACPQTLSSEYTGCTCS